MSREKQTQAGAGSPSGQECPQLVRRAAAEASEATFRHPWTPRSELRGAAHSRLVGLERAGVSLARLEPGRESFASHLHHREEEWIYVLCGRGVARIDGTGYEVEAGDFIGFPTPSVPHLMSNPFEEELVYLMGGENLEYEIADFPELDRRMLRRGDTIEIYRLSAGEPFPAAPSARPVDDTDGAEG